MIFARDIYIFNREILKTIKFKVLYEKQTSHFFLSVVGMKSAIKYLLSRHTCHTRNLNSNFKKDTTEYYVISFFDINNHNHYDDDNILAYVNHEKLVIVIEQNEPMKLLTLFFIRGNLSDEI